MKWNKLVQLGWISLKFLNLKLILIIPLKFLNIIINYLKCTSLWNAAVNSVKYACSRNATPIPTSTLAPTSTPIYKIFNLPKKKIKIKKKKKN